MKKWNLIVDVALCENCNNCVLAAKDELVDNAFPGYSAPHQRQGRGVVWIERQTRGSAHMVDTAYRPGMCGHCDAGPCLAAGADGAVRKREDGIVLIDPIKAKGRRDLVDACPYGAIVWNEAEQLPQNWFFDAHLLDTGWATPRCTAVCPTLAIEAVCLSDEDMAARAEAERLRTWHPEWSTRPRLYYRNLHRFDRAFVGGSLLTREGEEMACVAGARVELRLGGELVSRTISDAFGDFRFDDLPPDGVTYQIGIECDGLLPVVLDVEMEDGSRHLGDILLVKQLGPRTSGGSTATPVVEHAL